MTLLVLLTICIVGLFILFGIYEVRNTAFGAYVFTLYILIVILSFAMFWYEVWVNTQ